MVDSRDTNNNSWWNKHPTIISLLFSLCLCIIFLCITELIIIKPPYLSISFKKVVLNIAIFFSTFILTEVILKNFKKFLEDVYFIRNNLEKKITDLLYKTLSIRPCIIANIPTEEPSLESLLSELCKLNNKDLALGFAIDSLKNIKEKGFVQVRINIRDYSNFLQRSCTLAKKTILLTCIVRPLWFFDDYDRDLHLEHFYQSNATQKVRLIILEQKEILNLIKDTMNNLYFINKASNINLKNNQKLKDLPEADFFKEKLNCHPYNESKNIKVYWCCEEYLIHPKWPGLGDERIISNKITTRADDYAIFDNEYILKFEFLEPSTSYGDMFLSWGNDNINKYKKIFNAIENANNDINILKRIGIFSSFKSLVYNCASGMELAGGKGKKWEIGDEKISFSNIPEPILKLLNLNGRTEINLKEFSIKIYTKLIDELGKSLKIKEKYLYMDHELINPKLFQSWLIEKNLISLSFINHEK